MSLHDGVPGHLLHPRLVRVNRDPGNILQRYGLPPAPERKRTTTWPAFIRAHLALLAGTDFFTAEVLTLRGLVTSLGQKIESVCRDRLQQCIAK